MLRGLDALVFDIQDVGVRFYTYESTMIYAMEEAAKAKLPFYVLDRPNPITGIHVEGPMLDADKLSFTGSFPLPLRHGMTMGELAKLVNGEKRLNADLHVIEMTGWNREDWFDATGLPWVNPSPNIRSLNEALLYPGIAMLESSTNYSVGRGTDAPFEQIGADWIDGRQLARYLESRAIPGVRCYPVQFTPTSSNFSGKTIQGVHFIVTNRDVFSSSRLGLELAAALASALSEEDCGRCKQESDRQQRRHARSRRRRRCRTGGRCRHPEVSAAASEISDLPLTPKPLSGGRRRPGWLSGRFGNRRSLVLAADGRPRFFASTIHDGGRPRRRPRPRARRSRLNIASSSCSRSWRNSSRIFETSIASPVFCSGNGIVSGLGSRSRTEAVHTTIITH